MKSLGEHFADLDQQLVERLRSTPSDAIDDLVFYRVFPRSDDFDGAAHVDRLISHVEGGSSLVDSALNAWIETSWPPRESEDPAATAEAWITAFRVVLRHRDTHLSYAAFLDRFGTSEAALGWLSEGPTRDPLRWYLQALARWQPDRRLVDYWWELCDLRRGHPWYRGEVGLLGLTHLPAAEPNDFGFPTEVVAGTLRYGLALARHAREGAMGPGEALRHFVAVARRMRRSFPLPDLWAEAIVALRFGLASLPDDWLDAALPEARRALELSVDHGRVSVASQDRQEEWPQIAIQTARALRRNPNPTIAAAFLDEQREYAESSGDFDPLVRSLTYFADRVLRPRPEVAEAWAREALGWDPCRDASWTAYISALLQKHEYGRASEEALRMYEIVPWQANSHHQLGLALEQAGQLYLAEAVQRLAVQRFADNPYPVGGLAHVLLAQGYDAEAYQRLREGVRRFPDNPLLKTYLAIVLTGTGEAFHEEVGSLLDEAARSPDAPPLTKAARRRLDEGGSLRSLIAVQPISWKPSGMAALRVKRVLRNAARFGLIPLPTDGAPIVREPELAPRVTAEEVLTRAVAGSGTPTAVAEQAAAARSRYPGSVEVVYAHIKARLAEAQDRSLHVTDEHGRAVLADLEYLKALRTIPAVANGLIFFDVLGAYVDGAALDRDMRISFTRLREVIAARRDVDRALPLTLAQEVSSTEVIGGNDGRAWLSVHRAVVDDVEEAEIFALL